jgi:hypothetical protein
VPCVHLMKLLCTKFVGVVVFEKKRFEAIVDGNAYA